MMRADSSGRAIPGVNQEGGTLAKLLHRCEKKGVLLAADRTVACDLASVVNPVGFPQDPAGVWRNKPVQVLHSAAISGNEGVIFVATGGRKAYYGAAVVDRHAPGTGSAERA